MMKKCVYVCVRCVYIYVYIYDRVYFVVDAHPAEQDAPRHVLHILPPTTYHLEREMQRKREKTMEKEPKRENNDNAKSNASTKK